MKSKRMLSIAVVTGAIVLISAGQAEKNIVATPAHQPMVYRFYEGTDGLSHVERIELDKFNLQGSTSNRGPYRFPEKLIPLLTGSGTLVVHDMKPDPPGTVFSGSFHPAAHRQYIFNIQGHEEIEFSGGERITLNPGDIELAEDVAPSKGHRNIVLGPEDRIALFAPIKDQTVVRGAIFK